MMRMPPSLLVAATCGMMLASARMGNAFEPAHQGTIEDLVDQLSAAELRTRVAAEKRLRELGTDALDALPDPRTLAPQAAQAVRRIRTHLQRQHAHTALQATRVSLTGRSTLAETVAAISRQTGNRLDVSALPESTRDEILSVDLVDVPFWEAIFLIEQQSSLVAEPGEDRDVLVLKVRDEPMPPVAVVGPFRLTLANAAVRPDFTMPDRRLVRFTFQVAAEPRLRPLFVHVADADLSVTRTPPVDQADRPRPFDPLSPTAQHEIPVDRPGPVQFTHDVVLPEDPAPSPLVVSIRGSLEVETAADRETFVFRHLDEDGPVTRRHGGVSVTLEDVRHSDDNLRASLQILYDADGPRFESHRSWVFHNDVQLTTGDQRVLPPAEFETLDEGDNGVELRYRFAPVAASTDDTRLSYTAPTLITRVAVEFVFGNVSIPSERSPDPG